MVLPATYLSCCAGAGGLDLALALAMPGCRCMGYVERDAYAAAVLVARMEDAALDQAVIWDDLHDFPSELYRGRVDMLIGGIPCQPHSVAGKRAIGDDPRDLWPTFWRLVQEVDARWIFVENTPGIAIPNRAEGHEAGLTRILADLAESGWAAEWVHLSSAACGASHKRERFWLLAHASGEDDRRGGQRRDRAAGAIQPDPTDGHVAHGPRGGLGIGGEPSRRDGQPDGGGETLADAPDAQGRGHEPKRGPDRRTAAGRAGAELADSGGAGREERRCERGDVGQERQTAERDRRELPVFPPRPGDLDAWRTILADHPELAPAVESGVRGMASGLAPRVDRLRLIGNGVDPVAGCAAFLALYARLQEE